MLTVLVFCWSLCRWRWRNRRWNRGNRGNRRWNRWDRGKWGKRWQEGVVLDGVGENIWGELEGGVVDGVYEVG